MGQRLTDEELLDLMREAVKADITKHAAYFWLRRTGYSVGVPRVNDAYQKAKADGSK